jgi:hypothetical protein
MKVYKKINLIYPPVRGSNRQPTETDFASELDSFDS